MAETNTKEWNLYQKLAAISGDIGAISKDGKNSEQNFDFIEYAAVAGRLRTLFAKYGVVIVPRMQQTIKQHREVVTSKYGKAGQSVLIDMSFTVLSADKPDDKFTVTWTGEAVDYGDKATNKAATSALKYYLMRQFNISEKGDDPDAESHELKAPKADKAAKTASDAKKVMDKMSTPEPLDKLKDELADVMEEAGFDTPKIRAAMGKLKTEADFKSAITKTKEKLARG